VGFQPTVSADEPPHTYALHHAATGMGVIIIYKRHYENFECTACRTQGRLLKKHTAILPIHKSEKVKDNKFSFSN
jgi:hypothetical protein